MMSNPLSSRAQQTFQLSLRSNMKLDKQQMFHEHVKLNYFTEWISKLNQCLTINKDTFL